MKYSINTYRLYQDDTRLSNVMCCRMRPRSASPAVLSCRMKPVN